MAIYHCDAANLAIYVPNKCGTQAIETEETQYEHKCSPRLENYISRVNFIYTAFCYMDNFLPFSHHNIVEGYPSGEAGRFGPVYLDNNGSFPMPVKPLFQFYKITNLEQGIDHDIK